MISKNQKIKNEKELAYEYIGSFLNTKECTFGLDENKSFMLQIFNIESELAAYVYESFEEMGIMTQTLCGSYIWDLKGKEAVKLLKLVKEYSEYKEFIDHMLIYERMFVFDLGFYVNEYT